MTASISDAYKLFQDGSIALAQVEASGIRVDTDYLDRTIREYDRKIKRMEKELQEDEVWTVWEKHYGRKSTLSSRVQLGHVLFNLMGLTCSAWTSGGVSGKGRPQTTDAVLRGVNLPFVEGYLRLEKFKKMRGTYLEGIRREVCQGFIHPSFNLAGGPSGGGEDDKGGARSFRSCVAGGTMIEIVRDVSLHPKGIPIEQVRAGDFVYCYDDDLKLTIRKVLWAGKTGRRRIIRLHWRACRKKGVLEVTPEHKVRLINGDYVEARELEGKDFRKRVGGKNKSPKIRVLAMGRIGDRIWQTGEECLLDHRLVYEQLMGNLEKEELVHHKDGNHLNNTPSNLQKMTKSEHARHHVNETLTPEARQRGTETRLKMIANGEIEFKSGHENPNWVPMTRYQFLRMLAASRGWFSRSDRDHSTMNSHAEHFGIDLWRIKDRYGADGRYISMGRLLRASYKGTSVARRVLGVNYYKLKRLYEERGISFKRKWWGNQFGRFTPGNHRIVKVEWTNKFVPVYDIEVQGTQNFIAGEICVHNSASAPNFQNIPVRNKEIAKVIRQCFIPREGHLFGEIDFGAIEVRVRACHSLDPVLIKYVTDLGSDMHKDWASRCFLIKPEQVSKDARYVAKNQFVFPKFYGSYYRDCAVDMWDSLDKMKLSLPDGTSIKKHLKSQGIKKLGACDPQRRPVAGTFEHHVQEVEQEFESTFAVDTAWKKSWWEQYQEEGAFDLLTGFHVEGSYRKNQVINMPVQGAAFHCLLQSLIWLQGWLRKNRMKSLIIGQIHDSVVMDILEEELESVLARAHQIMTEDLPAAWDWLIVPLIVEAEVAPLGKSWWDKRPVNPMVPKKKGRLRFIQKANKGEGAWGWE